MSHPSAQHFHTTPMTLLLLLSTFIHTITSQVIVKKATLTPSNSIIDGARLVTNFNEVQTVNDKWSVKIYSHNTWQFIISLDNSYGFNPLVPSLISITMDASSLYTSEMLFGFTTDNTHYVSMSIPLDNRGRANYIYPSCIPSLRSTQSFGFGDIASIPNYNRKCDIAGGDCINWRNMIPSNHASDAQMPITFIFEYFPMDNLLEIYFEDSSSRGLVQRCTYAAGFSIDNGLKVYIAGGNPAETFIVSSFDVLSITYHPTTAPTHEPTPSPTRPTTNPTPIPTKQPTPAPTERTQTPTNPPTDVSQSPTLKPIQSPTEQTSNPTASPTTNPTIVTTNPTAHPSATPTSRPTQRPIQPGFVWGAFDQLCPQNVAATGYCRDATDIYYGNNINCLEPYSCCMCATIECGFRGIPCGRVTMGPSAAYGVKNIRVAGDTTPGFGGAAIDCQGTAACEAATIYASDVAFVDCDGDQSCTNATIIITDPKPNFALECSGMESCHNLNIEINLSEVPPGTQCVGLANIFIINKIVCNTNRACEGLQITINNAGCDKVMIETLECLKTNACDGAVFNFIGDVEIQHCACGPSCTNAVGLKQCFLGLEFVQCADPLACAFQSQTITDPRNGFEFLCSDVSSCQGGTFLIELTTNLAKPTTQLAKFIFGGEDAARDSTIIIDNRQGIVVSIDLIECGGKHACAGTTFVLGSNVLIENIICASDACYGCTIQRTPGTPALPCDPTSVGMF